MEYGPSYLGHQDLLWENQERRRMSSGKVDMTRRNYCLATDVAEPSVNRFLTLVKSNCQSGIHELFQRIAFEQCEKIS